MLHWGVGVQQVVPLVFKDLVPVELQFGISWPAVIEGLLLGIVVSILFTVLPLISVRFVPPLTVLRTDFEGEKVFSRARIVVITLIVLFPVVSAAYQTGKFVYGLSFAAGIMAALGLLTLVALAIL
ncbi:MAG: hypothetical protein WDO15_20855 [Bacteroidota bacterium]